MKRFRNISFLSLRTILILVILLSAFCFLLSAAPEALADPQPSSTSFQLKDFGFGAGGIATSSSTNFMFQGIAGEIESASLSSTNFRIGPGLTYTLQPNIPPAPTFTNPSNYYNKLKLVVNTGGNPTDTTYAIAVTQASTLTTIAQDSFTESGTGLVALSTHTAEVGGTWTSSGLSLDRTNDYTVIDGTGGGNKTGEARLASVSAGDGDLYVTLWPSGTQVGAFARFISANNNAYGVFVSSDADVSYANLTLMRRTAGTWVSIATNTAIVGITNPVRVRFQFSGSSPTILRVRAWNSALSEPGTWNIDTTDSTAANQTANGPVGLYMSGSTTFGYGVADDLLVTSGSGSQTSTNYVQADGTLGSIPVWQNYTAWGGASPGTTIIGLDTGTAYSAQVAAKRGTFTQGGFGPTATAATINPTFTFSLQTTSQSVPPFSVFIGQLNAGAVTTSTDKITATISTNSNNGGLVYLYGTNAGLKSTIAGNYNIGSVSNDLSSILEGYGARGTSVTQTSGGPMELISPYNGAGNNVGIIDTAKRVLSDSTSQPVSGGQTSFELQAKAKNTTPSATDYTDTLTVIATGSF